MSRLVSSRRTVSSISSPSKSWRTVWTCSMEFTGSSLMWVMTSPACKPQARAGETGPSWVVMSDRPTTSTPWAKSLMPTAWPRGTTVRTWPVWPGAAAWAWGRPAAITPTRAASRSTQRKQRPHTPRRWSWSMSRKGNTPFAKIQSARIPAGDAQTYYDRFCGKKTRQRYTVLPWKTLLAFFSRLCYDDKIHQKGDGRNDHSI